MPAFRSASSAAALSLLTPANTCQPCGRGTGPCTGLGRPTGQRPLAAAWSPHLAGQVHRGGPADARGRAGDDDGRLGARLHRQAPRPVRRGARRALAAPDAAPRPRCAAGLLPGSHRSLLYAERTRCCAARAGKQSGELRCARVLEVVLLPREALQRNSRVLFITPASASGNARIFISEVLNLHSPRKHQQRARQHATPTKLSRHPAQQPELLRRAAQTPTGIFSVNSETRRVERRRSIVEQRALH
jgi:hypothetical protein